jgi:hypothetical protein
MIIVRVTIAINKIMRRKSKLQSSNSCRLPHSKDVVLIPQKTHSAKKLR